MSDTCIDDEPPPLEGDLTCDAVEASNNDNELSDKNTLMEEIMETSLKARKSNELKARKLRNKNEKKFGAGLKAGFLSGKNLRSERKSAKLETIKPKKDYKQTSLQLPEVQVAMSQLNQLDPNEWMNKDFLSHVSKNPRLCAALQNPRFAQALEDLKKDPGAAMIKYQNDEVVQRMLLDFMGVLGNHFESLGNAKKSEAPSLDQEPPTEDAIRRSAIEKMDRSPEDEETVQRILNDPELQRILGDAKMREVLEKCSNPGVLRRYMSDNDVGPKLKKLIDAGLVQVHP